MATILLLSGPQPEPARHTASPRSTARHARRLRRRRPHRRGPRPGTTVEHVQSNHEGELVDAIGARGRCPAIVINPGAYTHYVVRFADALAAYAA